VENELHTTSIRQTTYQDFVTKSGLRRFLFDKYCLRRMIFMTHFLLNLFRDVCDLKFLILPANSVVVKMIQEKRWGSASVDIV